jgi:tubulysin polyketide synthase-like protein
MTAVEVLQTLQARDIQLMVEGDQLRYDAPEGAITEEMLTLLRQHKAALLALPAQSAPAHDMAATALSPQEACPQQEHGPALQPLYSGGSGSCTPAPLTEYYPCVVCGRVDRWDDHGIWRCRTCWPPQAL